MMIDAKSNKDGASKINLQPPRKTEMGELSFGSYAAIAIALLALLALSLRVHTDKQREKDSQAA
jgi:hypothetical protein